MLDILKTNAGPCDYHNQDWYFPVPVHTFKYQNAAGRLLAKPNLVFQQTSFPSNHVCLFIEQANRERFFPPTTSPYYFHSSTCTSVTLLSSLALLGVALSLPLTVIQKEF